MGLSGDVNKTIFGFSFSMKVVNSSIFSSAMNFHSFSSIIGNRRISISENPTVNCGKKFTYVGSSNSILSLGFRCTLRTSRVSCVEPEPTTISS